MLSATYTVSDVKAKLRKGYAFYGYTDDAAFTSDIESTASDVYLLYFLPRIGETAYNNIADKDKVDLTVQETYFYWAEVYTICYLILQNLTSDENQLSLSGNESLRVEGYQYTVSSSETSGNDSSLSHYHGLMYRYWMLAGYNLNGLQRTCTIFGDYEYNEEEDYIIE